MNESQKPVLGTSGLSHNYTSKEDLMKRITGYRQMLNLAEHHNESETASKFKQIITELEQLLVNSEC
jgi:AraC-like DNA-binding protein